ncbi:hypothetical protein CDAR_371761 [Caerostris darwini]|uniref:Uncharacterized protein n=1 Tax=Caerostris darwini TaxID=1538125 RepID=A0AAV4NZU4_9ARAC|nr:hypothetical protein CDAR_127751 [Caerostris darwini]GIY30503.1 hypothetical protein CDAR_371761 [Caerostris darwini]
MSENLCNDREFGRKRSESLPASRIIFKDKGVVKFFSLRNLSGSESSSSLESINFLMEINKYPELDVSDYEEILTEVCSKIHLHPNARFSTKLARPHVQDQETWKHRFLRVSRNISRRIRQHFRH